jgi:RND family efflux transporter MFP subunit
MSALKTILLSIPVAFAMVACHSEAEEQKKSESKPAEVQSAEVTDVKSLKPTKSIALPGELKPWNKVSIHPKVKGFVHSVRVDRGTHVRKGQILAVLDAPEILSELSQAKAQLAAAEASLSEHTNRLRTSSTTYNRIIQTNRTKGAVSLNEIDLAHSRVLSDSSNVALARGNVEASRSHLQAKKQFVSYLTITAPFDGIITERNISPGALVGPGEGSSKPLFILEDDRTLRLTVAIPENISGALPKESTVSFTVPAIPEKQFTAKFARSASSLAEENRSMMTEFDVDNRSNELKAGMYAQVQLGIERSEPTLFVPVTSVVTSSERVFVIRLSDDKAEWVTVKKGNVIDSLVEVFGNVREGDPIVKKASEELRDGQALKAAEKSKLAAK